MAKVIELRKIIQAYLKSVHPRVYYEQAPDNAQYPYLVFDLPNSFDDGTLEQFVLDVDGWDKGNDSTALENLMAVMDGDGMKLNPSGLHRKTVVFGGLSATFYRDNRLSPRDDDSGIIRRKIIYQVRTYGG